MLPMKEVVTEKSLLPYFYLFLEKTSQQEDSNGRSLIDASGEQIAFISLLCFF
jgi:hypothetical protein